MERTSTTRSCLITGATGGLGRALAEAFRSAGFHAIITGRDSSALRAVASPSHAVGTVTAITADLTSPTDVRTLQAAVLAELSELDVLVVNAAQTTRNTFLTGDEPLEQWRDMVLVNVFGAAAVTRAVLPLLSAAGGIVVFIGSVVGRTVVAGDMYSVTKHAVSALAEALRLEAEPAGVRVCLVQPGLMDTPLVTGSRRTRPLMRPAHVADEIVRMVGADLPFAPTEVVLRPRQ
jgi:NAD(P)-dependent dehydrogenase (short-subunit alcohol dehydrogenase family)